MKTIRAIKSGKDFEIGEIKRVDDKTAHNMVGYMWEYISKSEWKKETRKPKESHVEKSEPVQDKTEKKPYKKGQKPEKTKK